MRLKQCSLLEVGFYKGSTDSFSDAYITEASISI